MPSIKNIIIFLSIGLLMVLVYVFFIKGGDEESNLISSTSIPASEGVVDSQTGDVIGQEFLNLLLNVKNIKLDDSIFDDPAFMSLRDSSIVLIPDGNEGRPNPFAPIGSDVVVPPPDALAPTTPTTDTPATGNTNETPGSPNTN